MPRGGASSRRGRFDRSCSLVRTASATGSAGGVTMEGTRPLLVEVQALTAPNHSALPRRTAAGFDQARLLLLVAVLSRRLGMRLYDQNSTSTPWAGCASPARGGPGGGARHRLDIPRPYGGPSARRHRRGGAVRGAPSGRPARAAGGGGGEARLRSLPDRPEPPQPAAPKTGLELLQAATLAAGHRDRLVSSRCSAFDEGSASGAAPVLRPRWKRDVDALVNQRALYQRKLMENSWRTAGERAGGRIELDLASVLKALADPNRLRIVGTLLRRGETCVCEITDALGLPQYLVFPPPARAAGGWPGLPADGSRPTLAGFITRWSRMPVASAATALGEVLDAATIESECRAAACPSRSTGDFALGRD